jgi:hypothetical protein
MCLRRGFISEANLVEKDKFNAYGKGKVGF